MTASAQDTLRGSEAGGRRDTHLITDYPGISTDAPEPILGPKPECLKASSSAPSDHRLRVPEGALRPRADALARDPRWRPLSTSLHRRFARVDTATSFDLNELAL